MKIACTLALLLLATHLASASDANYAEKIDAIFAAAGVKPGDVPGAAVLVVKNSKVLFERGYGVTDLKSLRKIDAHTNFRLASVTKQFTAEAIMPLGPDGRFDYCESLT